MKNHFLFFALAFFISCLSLEVQGTALDDVLEIEIIQVKNGPIQVLLSLPVEASSYQLVVCEKNTGSVVFSTISNAKVIDLPGLKSGDYLVTLHWYGEKHTQLISL